MRPLPDRGRSQPNRDLFSVNEVLSPEYRWLWSAALAVALFFPVRQLIWVMSVRREQRKQGGRLPDEAARKALKKRANVTSTLLCLVFVALYSAVVFGGHRP